MNDALLRTAQGLQQAGKLADAERVYDDILRTQPRNVQALYALAYLHFGKGQFDKAERLFADAAKANPNLADAHFASGCALQRLGRHAEALASLEAALVLIPRRAELWLAQGDVLAAMNRREEAVASYCQAIALKPALVEAWNNRGAALFSLGRFEESVANYDAASAAGARNDTLHVGRGVALSRLNRHAEALASFDSALALVPMRADALYYRGTELIALQRYAEALAALDRALALAPKSANAAVARGIALKELGRVEEALASYAYAVTLRPDCLEAFVNRQTIFLASKRYDAAIGDSEAALAIDSDAPFVRGGLLYGRLHVCDWRDLPRQTEAIAARLKENKRVIQPFMYVALPGTAQSQQQCARVWAQSEIAPAPAPALWRGEHYAHKRIRLAYVSGDFREHPVAQLLVGVLEHHDKSRFETLAVSLAADDGSALRARVAKAVDRYADMRDRTDADIATFLRGGEIDIAVDLMGFTGRSRPGIFAHRAAPVQAQYLGFPGTMGTDFIDYILADRIVIPEEERRYYSERVVYLPDSYLPIDDTRRVAAMPSRAQAGLPEAGFVFASFNNSYKFAPAMFDIWMRLLSAVEGSILWLPSGNETAKKHLREAAKERGVSPDRLVFAPFVANPKDHLARLGLADLFLDTLPCNAHSTASDALLAGVPLLTCLGSSFAGRVAGSLLHAAGLPELVTHSLADYEALALKLARDSDALAAIRAKLAANRATAPFFDTARFTRNLEAAFTAMHERSARGAPPEAFAVR